MCRPRMSCPTCASCWRSTVGDPVASLSVRNLLSETVRSKTSVSQMSMFKSEHPKVVRAFAMDIEYFMIASQTSYRSWTLRTSDFSVRFNPGVMNPYEFEGDEHAFLRFYTALRLE